MSEAQPDTGAMALALRCEAASGADRVLDRDILIALHPGARAKGRDEAFIPEKGWEPGSYSKCAPNYSASIDAALTLRPEGALYSLETYDTNGVYPEHVRASAWVQGAPRSFAATPALALCAAALKARAHGQGGDGR